jgi:hypothetical protein
MFTPTGECLDDSTVICALVARWSPNPSLGAVLAAAPFGLFWSQRVQRGPFASPVVPLLRLMVQEAAIPKTITARRTYKRARVMAGSGRPADGAPTTRRMRLLLPPAR